MDTDNAAELPGFATPGHPNVDDRLFSTPGGNIRVTIMDNVPRGTIVPDYYAYISSESGRRVVLHLTARSGQVVREENANGMDRHVLIIPLDIAVIYPGTYRLRVLVNDREIFSKSLTVANHPALQ